MEYSQSLQDGECRLSFTGKFTFSDHARFRIMLDSVKKHALNSLHLNLRALEYMDSSALGMLLILKEEMDGMGVGITLAHPNESVSKLLKISGFGSLFTIDK